MIDERLVMATTHLAASIAEEDGAPQGVLSRRVAWLAGYFLTFDSDSPSNGLDDQFGWTGGPGWQDRAEIGFDETGEGRLDAPWYTH